MVLYDPSLNEWFSSFSFAGKTMRLYLGISNYENRKEAEKMANVMKTFIFESVPGKSWEDTEMVEFNGVVDLIQLHTQKEQVDEETFYDVDTGCYVPVYDMYDAINPPPIHD